MVFTDRVVAILVLGVARRHSIVLSVDPKKKRMGITTVIILLFIYHQL